MKSNLKNEGRALALATSCLTQGVGVSFAERGPYFPNLSFTRCKDCCYVVEQTAPATGVYHPADDLRCYFKSFSLLKAKLPDTTKMIYSWLLYNTDKLNRYQGGPQKIMKELNISLSTVRRGFKHITAAGKMRRILRRPHAQELATYVIQPTRARGIGIPVSLLDYPGMTIGHADIWGVLEHLDNYNREQKDDCIHDKTHQDIADIAHQSCGRVANILRDLESWGFIRVDRSQPIRRYNLLPHPILVGSLKINRHLPAASHIKSCQLTDHPQAPINNPNVIVDRDAWISRLITRYAIREQAANSPGIQDNSTYGADNILRLGAERIKPPYIPRILPLQGDIMVQTGNEKVSIPRAVLYRELSPRQMGIYGLAFCCAGTNGVTNIDLESYAHKFKTTAAAIIADLNHLKAAHIIQRLTPAVQEPDHVYCKLFCYPLFVGGSRARESNETFIPSRSGYPCITVPLSACASVPTFAYARICSFISSRAPSGTCYATQAAIAEAAVIGDIGHVLLDMEAAGYLTIDRTRKQRGYRLLPQAPIRASEDTTSYVKSIARYNNPISVTRETI